MFGVEHHRLRECPDNCRVGHLPETHIQEVLRVTQTVVWCNGVQPAAASHVGGDDGREPIDGRVETLDRAGIGARTDDEVLVAPAVHGCGQSLEHVADGDHVLAVEVPAPLGVHLILEMTTGQAGVLQHRDGPGRTHRLAESGVAVDERGQIGRPCDRPSTGGDLGQCGQSDVGQTQVRREYGAGDVHPLETDVGDELGHQRREGPRPPLQLTGSQTGAQRLALVGVGDTTGEQ